ncbi:ArnT family glycosyltransferase [Hymenobacter negativus]|uniref:Glycosyltransferase family 39 protein n=1 Tax=Hymenobacter negativus TaxID=2795026 RepID=A0ABS0Q814_9BACT|nr:glycosyltransferase family 39 protein [Hymenobacter negativus]MBH8558788.1 glycosyltransferase family 39 protein [Hymenobacter negativus]
MSTFNLRTFLTARGGSFYVRLYFGLLLVLGLCCYKDYGVSWDEPADRSNGMVSAKYVAGFVAPGWAGQHFANTPDIHGYLDNDHGVFFEMPLAFIDQIIGIDDSRTYFLMRHFAVFAVFAAGTWALYRIGRIRFNSWWLGLALSTLLVLSPRFFAEAFYNGKDVVFMAFFILGAYTLVRLLQRPSLARAAVHGVATAAAIDVRILGVLLVAFTVGMVGLEILFSSADRTRRLQFAKAFLLFGIVTVIVIIAGWPYLWEAPLDNFLTALENMKRFRWGGLVLYMGAFESALALPWHYAPVWIIITTPIAYIVAFLLGAGAIGYALLRRPLDYLRTFEGRLDVLFMGWFALPIIMVIALNSVIYDGWRHLYFVYPALLLVALRGAWALWQQGRQLRWLRPVAIGAASLASLEVAYTIGRIMQAHPQEQVYFSFLSGEQAARLFERDYWGLSYRQGLEWIAAHDPAPQLNVMAQNDGVIENNLAIIKPEIRARFRVWQPGQWVEAGPTLYFLGAYRTRAEPYTETLGGEIYAVKPFGITALSVLHQW